MYSYDHEALRNLIEQVLRNSLQQERYEQLRQADKHDSPMSFNRSFAAIPRITGRGGLQISEAERQNMTALRTGLTVTHWTADRLARVWLLMGLDAADRIAYQHLIENLFRSGAMNELVALYSALPLLAWPEDWRARCAEGVRSNIGDVLEAVMCDNPYPAEQLPAVAWNQLVLKAFFTEKPVQRILGLDQRANPALAETLIDYAHERWAAGRTVHPLVWRCVAPFVREQDLGDLKKLLASADPLEQEAGALACWHAPLSAAREWLSASVQEKLASGELSWSSLAEKTQKYVLQS